jgi:hypothetical protein
VQTSPREFIYDTKRKRGLAADKCQIDSLRRGKIRKSLYVIRPDRNAFRDRGNTGVSISAKEL